MCTSAEVPWSVLAAVYPCLAKNAWSEISSHSQPWDMKTKVQALIFKFRKHPGSDFQFQGDAELQSRVLSTFLLVFLDVPVLNIWIFRKSVEVFLWEHFNN